MKILESLSFTETLYAFDFDGTLAPIVIQPSQAKMKERTEELLDELSKVVTTAVISGRSLSDLKCRTVPSIRYLIGNHGLEGVDSQANFDGFKKQSQEWIQFLEKTLIKKAQDPGLEIEEKTYSIAIHYRKSRKKRKTKNIILEVLKEIESNSRIIPGKAVYNLVPLGGPHKGVALTQLLKVTGLNCALYIGDDDTDEDVFSLPDHRILSVRVGQKKGSAAKYYLRNQSEIDRLIRTLAEFRRDSKKN
jgi:trehalose 6-phosphate phosphatase